MIANQMRRSVIIIVNACRGCYLESKVQEDFLLPIFPFAVFVCVWLMWFFDSFWIVLVWHICSYVCYGFVRRVLSEMGYGKLSFWSEVHFGPVVYMLSLPTVLFWLIRHVVATAGGK